MVSRWDQELFGNHFSVLHWHTLMMANIDVLTRQFDNITTQYLNIATLLSHYDRLHCPAFYVGDLKSVLIATRILATDHTPTLDIPILTYTIINETIDTVATSQFYHSFSATENSQPSILSGPIMLHFLPNVVSPILVSRWKRQPYSKWSTTYVSMMWLVCSLVYLSLDTVVPSIGNLITPTHPSPPPTCSQYYSYTALYLNYLRWENTYSV